MDAFKILLKRRGDSDSLDSKRKKQTRSYTTCPICSRSIPAGFADIHTASCDVKSSSNVSQASICGSVTSSPQINHPTPTQNQTNNLNETQTDVFTPKAPVAAALPFASVHSDPLNIQGLVPLSATQCSGSSELISLTGHNLHEDATRKITANKVAAPEGARKDAFAVLMEGQRQLSQVHVFFLELMKDASWRCHWWQKGLPDVSPPAGLPECQWSTSMPVSLTRGARKQSISLILQTNVGPGQGGDISWENKDLPSNCVPQEGRWTRGIPALKSALQKNIRLGRGPCAVRCVMQLLKDDAQELLRRLPIICLEDALLHPNLPVLTWLMAAHSKGYSLGQTVCSEVLRIAYQISKVQHRDCLPKMNRPGRLFHHFSDVDDALMPDEAVIVKAVLLRGAFGGMTCDVLMLQEYAAYWAARFQGLVGIPPEGLSSHQVMQSQTCKYQSEHKIQPCSPKQPQTENNRPDSSEAYFAIQLGGCLYNSGDEPQDDLQISRSHASLGESSGEFQGFVTASSLVTSMAHDQAALQMAFGNQPGVLGDHDKEQQQQRLIPLSPWLLSLKELYQDTESAPPQLVSASDIRPLRMGDIPLSAIDFHVSDVVPSLLELPHVRAAAWQLSQSSDCMESKSVSEGNDIENLKSAMWLFRSSINNRKYVESKCSVKSSCPSMAHQNGGDCSPLLPSPQNPQGLLSEKMFREDTDEDEASRRALRSLWEAAKGAADLFSKEYIRKRFFRGVGRSLT